MTTDLPAKLNLTGEREAPSRSTDDSEAMAQIRDLLFGDQVAKLGARIDAIETLLDQRMTALSELVESRFEALAEDVASVDRKTNHRIETEQAVLQSGIDGVHHQLEQMTTALGDEIDRIKSDQAEKHSALTQQLKEQQEAVAKHSKQKDQYLASLFHELGNRVGIQEPKQDSD